MKFLDNPKKNWVFPPFFLLLWIFTAGIEEHVRFNYHGFYAAVRFTGLIAALISIVFSISNTFVMLKQIRQQKQSYHWIWFLMNVSPLLFIILSIVL